MATLRSCSLAQVAHAADVALSTASLALRDSPRVLPATKERIQAVAARLGYQPDLRVASLMARIRRNAALRDREHLAFVWVSTTKRESQQHDFPISLRQGARTRAEQLGCVLSEFWLNDEGMSARRLEQILGARGITGVIFSAPLHDMEVRIDWDWSHFAGAVIGNTNWTPNLHRVAHHHYRSMWTTMEHLRGEGSQRPAALLHEAHHRRLHGVQWAAFVANHPQPALAPAMARFDRPADPGELRGWFRRIRADALILSLGQDRPTVEKLRQLSGIRRVVALDYTGSAPGVDMRHDLIAATAVETVVAQLHRNERGIPRLPSTLLLEGEWRE